jgi:hypothetical protein
MLLQRCTSRGDGRRNIRNARRGTLQVAAECLQGLEYTEDSMHDKQEVGLLQLHADALSSCIVFSTAATIDS